MPRFFRRLREGIFDEDDLWARADELARFLAAAESEYGVSSGSWTAVGFSNGANIASALLIRHPEVLAAAVLVAAMVPFRAGPGAADHTGKRVAVVNGRRDPIADPDQTATLARQLRERGAAVTLFEHDGGHQIDPVQLPELATFVAGGAAPSD